MKYLNQLKTTPVIKSASTVGRFKVKNLRLVKNSKRAGEYLAGQLFYVNELTGVPAWYESEWDLEGKNFFLPEKYNLNT